MLSLLPRTLPRYSVLTTALIFVATSTILWTTLYNVPILSSKLPAYTGPHRVGAIDLEADVAEPRIISSDAVFKETGKPAFQLDTVFFTLFYPAGDNLRIGQNIDKEKHKASHLWVPRPLSLVAEGYARFASLSFFPINQIFTFFLWLLVGSTKIPAEVDVPVYTPENLGGTHRHHNGGASDASTPPKFPIIIFTHGMAGMRTSYSQYCGELASRGYVVAAIEHRDGSGPGSMIMRKSGRTSKAVHMKAKDLESDPPLKGDALKQTQLAFREAEMEETIRMLRDIDSGRGDWYEHQNPRHEGENLMSFKDRLDLDTVVVAGHSYGATGALLALKDAPSEKLPFKGAIIQDPGKSSGPLNKNIRVPTLIINSGSWTSSQSTFYGRPHFEVVRDVARTVLKAGHKAWFLTLSGTAHPSVTDAPLIEKWLMRAVTGTKLNERTAIDKYVQITKEFMMFLQDGKTRGVLGAGVTDEDGPLADGRAEHEGKDWSGFWKVHVAPE